MHHDPTQGWVLLFAILILGGLLTSLFVPRRRVGQGRAAGGRIHHPRVRGPGPRRGPHAGVRGRGPGGQARVRPRAGRDVRSGS
ncbi:cytochrome c biogenesis protein ResB [Clavibacter tessellarius]